MNRVPFEFNNSGYVETAITNETATVSTTSNNGVLEAYYTVSPHVVSQYDSYFNMPNINLQYDDIGISTETNRFMLPQGTYSLTYTVRSNIISSKFTRFYAYIGFNLYYKLVWSQQTLETANTAVSFSGTTLFKSAGEEVYLQIYGPFSLAFADFRIIKLS